MNLASDDMRRDPFPVYDHMRAACPVFYVPPMDLWMIFDYGGVKRALHDHDAFSSTLELAGRASPPWFIFFDPPPHTKLRGLVLRAFTPRVVAGLEPRVRELSRQLLAPAIERGEIDLAEDFAVPLPTMVIADMLGIPASDRERFTRWAEAILDLSYEIVGGAEAARAAVAYRQTTAEMSDYLADLLAQRRAAPTDDLLTRLADAELDGERLCHEDILGFFQLLLIAGTETTTNLIDNAMLCFLDHPDQLTRLRAQPDLLPSAIEEVLRYRSPVQAIFRTTRRDVELGGQLIPAGKLVLPMIGAANRDPVCFADPGRFDIARDPNPHVAFGHGVHFCLGAALSRLEARVALTELLARANDIERATDQPWQPRKALHIHGPTHLPIRFTPAPDTGRV